MAHASAKSVLQQSLDAIEQAPAMVIWGELRRATGDVLTITGLSGIARLGDIVEIPQEGETPALAEIISLLEDECIAISYGSLKNVRLNTKIRYLGQMLPKISEDWIGKVLDPFGKYPDGSGPRDGGQENPLNNQPPNPVERLPIGARLNTGLAAFDTFLPLCEGQRLGLFAGSGVGKSMLLADLAKGVEAEIVVLALIGERGREVNSFVNETLGEAGMKRAVVIAATSNDPAPVKKRAALLAMSVAEYFRDQGRHVLVLFDSLTRFAEAHRETALCAGEIPSLRAYPPSTFRAIASLCERAGPGTAQTGTITGVFSVLVAGSNMEEPVADMVRGILDGHVVLERSIAERGRFPAIDIRKSVSRALPDAATPEENAQLISARHILALYDDSAALIRAGLYSTGSDPELDAAIARWPQLDAFIGERTEGSTIDSYQNLGKILTGTEASSDREAGAAPEVKTDAGKERNPKQSNIN